MTYYPPLKMAMAGLIQEIEDPLPHFPPAPPPSPEAQRACNIFEIPTSAFNPLDMRQKDFADLDLILSQTQNSSRNPFLETVHERENPFADEDEYGFPASPKKRICNSPCSLPDGYNIQSNEFHSGGKLTSSSLPHTKATRHHRSPVHSHSPPLLNVPSSNSPPPLNQSFHQTSPYSIPPHKPENGFEISNFQPVHSYNPSLSPPSQLGMLSKSFDLHNVHAFETNSELALLPNVRPRRAYTLDAGSKKEEASRNRRRKISLKRTKEERDSDLQFSFEYSYTSTGSSEESDWLVVTPDTTASLPLGKKACQTIPISPPPSFPLNFANSSFMDPSVASNLPPSTSIFNPPTPTLYYSQFDQQPPSLVSMDSSVQMMDTGDTSLRFDSIDSMECGGDQFHSFVEMDTQTENGHPSHYHTTHSTLYPPTPLRSHSSEDRYAPTRHSFIQGASSLCTEQDVSNSISRSL